jgi:oligopeptide transport system permease protein
VRTIRYILSRLGQSLFTLFCIVTITFFMIRLAPGSPFQEDKTIEPHLIAKMEAYYGFDKPLPVQYFKYLSNFIRGDLGPSTGNKGFTVNDVIAQGWPVSATIGLLGLVIALAFGIPIGVYSAAHRNSGIDYGLMGVAMIGICLPTFVIGPLLAVSLGLKLDLFDVAGWTGSTAWMLASLTLGLYYAAYIARLTRGSMLDMLSQDWVRTARAKGVSPNKVLFKHAFRGGITPVIAYLGPALAGLIGGSFVVESIFALPGLGQHFIKAATNRDYTLILGTVTVFAILILAMNFVVDLAQTWLDPRRRLKA